MFFDHLLTRKLVARTRDDTGFNWQCQVPKNGCEKTVLYHQTCPWCYKVLTYIIYTVDCNKSSVDKYSLYWVGCSHSRYRIWPKVHFEVAKAMRKLQLHRLQIAIFLQRCVVTDDQLSQHTHTHTKGMTIHGMDLIWFLAEIVQIHFCVLSGKTTINNTFIPKSLPESFELTKGAGSGEEAAWPNGWANRDQTEALQGRFMMYRMVAYQTDSATKTGPEWRWKISIKWTNAKLLKAYWKIVFLKESMEELNRVNGGDPTFNFLPISICCLLSSLTFRWERFWTGATGGVSPWQEFFITCQRGISASWISGCDFLSDSNLIAKKRGVLWRGWRGFSQDIQSVYPW